MANVISMKALLEAGVHFGHQTRRWDPRMRPYIFTERNGLHIIDLQQTVIKLGEAYNFVRDLIANGGTLMMVGTKKQAQEAIEQEATRVNQFYVNQRWLGGMLTNFRTIQERLRYLRDLESRREKGEFARLPKKEVIQLEEEIARLDRLFSGIRTMGRVPSAIYIVDPHKERLAVQEALRLHIPIIALCDTNCNPDEIDYPIPANDDAIRAVKLLTSRLADAAAEGLRLREARLQAAKDQAQEQQNTYGMRQNQEQRSMAEVERAMLARERRAPVAAQAQPAAETPAPAAETPAPAPETQAPVAESSEELAEAHS